MFQGERIFTPRVVLLQPLVVVIKKSTSGECAHYAPYSVGKESQANLNFAETICLFEESRHGSDQHLPAGVVYG